MLNESMRKAVTERTSSFRCREVHQRRPCAAHAHLTSLGLERQRPQRDLSQLTYRGHVLSRSAHALREAKQRFGERDVLARPKRLDTVALRGPPREGPEQRGKHGVGHGVDGGGGGRGGGAGGGGGAFRPQMPRRR